jgi:hypothetical protein
VDPSDYPSGYFDRIQMYSPTGKKFVIDNLVLNGVPVPVIDKVRGVKEPRGKISIIGSGFGEPPEQGAVHIGNDVFALDSLRIKRWSDTKIKVRLLKYPCKWFGVGNDFRRIKVWVTVNGVDSNVKKIKVMKPDTCPD